jgi:hypothetical protein
MKIKEIVKTSKMRKYRNGLFVMMASALLALPFPVNGGSSLTAPTSASLAAAAGSGLVYIIGSGSGGDAFGDEPGSVGGNYRGLQFTYTFDLPGVDATKDAQVILSSKSLAVGCNRFEINGVHIDTVLRDHNDSAVWETEQGRILPSVRLRETGNTLRIAARNTDCTTGGNEDDFVVANVVIHYAQK